MASKSKSTKKKIGQAAEKRKDLRENKRDMQHKTIAKRIKALQNENDITNIQLAEACYRDAADISRWRNEESFDNIPVYELSLISDYLDTHTDRGCCVEYLIGQSDARHFEYDSLVEKTGLSDASITELISRNKDNQIECIDSLLVNAKELLTSLYTYGLLTQISQIRKGNIEEKKIEDAVAIGRIAYDAAITDSDNKKEPLFELFKKHLLQALPDNVDSSGLSDDNLARVFEFTADAYQIEVQQQKCIKELTLYLESMK